MSDAKTHTITLKGPGNGEPWLVLGGASIDELEAALQQAFPELADHLSLPEMIWHANGMWHAVRAVVTGGLAGPEAPQAAQGPPQGVQGGYGAPTAPQGPPAGAGGNLAPSCQHGPRVWREAKPGSGKSWKGWFCPTAQGTPNQCKPQFV